MADENKKFPNGWGSDEDDDDYGFIDDTDEDDEDSAWGNGSPFKKKESVTDSNENEKSDNVQTESSVPAQEVKTSENSDAPVPPVNPPYNQGYVIQKQKSNPLFIIVIIILVLIIGVLCTAIFVVNKNKKTNDSEKSDVNSVDEISETTSKNTENDNTETEIPDITTAATTETITESTTNRPASDNYNNASAYANAYIELRSKMIQEAGNGLAKWYRADGLDFYLHVDGDYSYYKYEYYMDNLDNTSKLIANSITSDSEVYLTSGSGGFICVVNVTPYSEDGMPGKTITCTSNQGTKETFESFSIKILNSHLSYRSGPGYDYEENGVITDHGTYTIIDESNGWGKLESGIGWINLKDAESYEGAGGLADDGRGYDEVETYPCNYLGVINTRGLGVTGFATSYVVDGGEAKEVRHRLGDWHVKAVNWCYSKDILWYELYDAEDGDYYGWVDAEYIDFSPSDTSEYTDKSNLIATGKVITEKDDLNMRESDSATSKIVTTIPKGHSVGIISEYGDWLYVKYYADTNSPIYYGFVSKQFIEITERYGNR